MVKNVKPKPISSLELAKIINDIFLFFTEKEDLKYAQALTHLKLQKLMWFCYLEYCKKTKEKLISENFQAWENGPISAIVFEDYKKYEAEIITDSTELKDDKYIMDKDKFELIVHICVKYRYTDVREMVGKSHNDLWEKYFNHKSTSEIPWEEVQQYYIWNNW